MRFNRYFLNACLLCLLPACGTLRHGRTVAAKAEVPRRLPSSEELEVGQVAFVRGDADSPFVLIALDRGVTLPEGARLEAASMNASTTRLITTSQRRDGYQVANIVSGRPRPGDPVKLRYPDSQDPWLNQDADPSSAPVSDADADADADNPSPPPFLKAPTPPVEELPLPLELPLETSVPVTPPPLPAPNPATLGEDVVPRPPTSEAEPLELPTLDPSATLPQPADSTR